jgi:signal recognition particle receptor subunit beta
MVLFNYSTKELTAKVVYYGPGLCGKTTNLQWVHEKLPIKNKGKMLSLATETDRTLFFDFLPIEIGTIRGMKTRIQLYTVPGQVFYNATRRMVLKGADAVVFVCDSQEAMLDANLESFENMRQNLEANEIDPDEIPTVFQYNKRDLPNALPIEILNERMNLRNYPFYEAVAVTGIGVEDTLKAVTKLVFKSLSVKYGEAPPLLPRARRPRFLPPPSGPPGTTSSASSRWGPLRPPSFPPWRSRRTRTSPLPHSGPPPRNGSCGRIRRGPS